MSGKMVYRDESRIRHMANALAKIAEKSQGIERKDLVEGEDNTELYICSEQMYMAAEFPSLSDCPGEIAVAADGEQKCRETVSHEVGCRV